MPRSLESPPTHTLPLKSAEQNGHACHLPRHLNSRSPGTVIFSTLKTHELETRWKLWDRRCCRTAGPSHQNSGPPAQGRGTEARAEEPVTAPAPQPPLYFLPPVCVCVTTCEVGPSASPGAPPLSHTCPHSYRQRQSNPAAHHGPRGAYLWTLRRHRQARREQLAAPWPAAQSTAGPRRP